jgi:hypothetical protein
LCCLSFPLGHCIVCLFLLVIALSVFYSWSLYCLSFTLGRKRQTIQWPRGKDRQYNDQREKTDNAMTKRKRQTMQWPRGKDIQYNDQEESFPLGHCIVCLFLLGIVLSVFSTWSLHCLSFPLGVCTIQWPRGKDRQYNDQEEKTDNTMTKRKRHTIQWPRGKDRQYNDQKKKKDKRTISAKIICRKPQLMQHEPNKYPRV